MRKFSKRRFAALLSAALSLCAVTATGQPNQVKSVTIKSTWGGLVPPPPSGQLPPPAKPNEWVVQNQGDNHFYSDGASVPERVVESLVEAIGAAPIQQLRPSDLGITQKWLEDTVEARRKSKPLYHYASDLWLPSFRAAFTNQSLIESVLPSLFSGFHTDDYPFVEINVVFANGKTWSATSNSQHEFMVPWQVKAGTSAFTTWNVNLAKAAAALLPEGATNRNRLDGARFSYDLADVVMEHVKAEWMSPALSLLRTRYTVERAVISERRAPLSQQGNGARVWEAYLDVWLGGGALPKWLQIDARLPVQRETVLGADELLRLAPVYENLVRSFPWLDRWFTDHQQSAQIIFDGGRSLHEEATAIFDTDMRAMGKESLLNQVLAVRDQVALVAINNYAFWLVLPDRRMVLWRFRALTNIPRSDSRIGLIKWSWADFPTIERLDAWNAWRECAGAVISAEGDLVK
jgi:hypothetical protein